MNEASSCSAEDVRVRECFFVNVRKARGRKVAGGRMIGRIAAFGALMLKGFRGWTGVPKAGEDEGMAEDGIALCFRKIGAGVRSMMAVFDASTRLLPVFTLLLSNALYGVEW
jgi:hypothetical protein